MNSDREEIPPQAIGRQSERPCHDAGTSLRINYISEGLVRSAAFELNING